MSGRSPGHCARRLLGRLALAAMLAGVMLPPARADLAIDQRGERQIGTALTLAAEARALDVRQIGSGRRIRVYVGAPSSKLILREVSVTADGANALQHRFEPAELAALRQGTEVWVGTLTLDRGPHHLAGTLTAGLADGSGDRPSPLALSAEADAGEAVDSLELEPVDPGLFSSASATLRQSRVARPEDGLIGKVGRAVNGWFGSDDAVHIYQAGSEADPSIRYSRFLTAKGDGLHAAAELLEVRRRGQLGLDEADVLLQLSEALLDYGMPLQGLDAYADAVRAKAYPAAATRVRLRLAESFFERGDARETDLILGNPPAGLSSEMLGRWQDLKIRLLISKGQTASAIALLNQTPNTGDYYSYVRYYNLGILLFNRGQKAEGLTALDRVGTLVGQSSELAALRDKANLSLGILFLREGQAATAIPIFQRIRSRGPFSDQAFLYLGWAWMGPPGTTQRRHSLGDERLVGPPPESVEGRMSRDSGDKNLYQRYSLQRFVRLNMGTNASVHLERAMTNWSELLDRSADSETVQVGMLDAGDALDDAGAHRQALSIYLKVRDGLEQSQAELLKAQLRFQTSNWFSDVENAVFGRPSGNPLADDPGAGQMSDLLKVSGLSQLLAESDIDHALRTCDALRLASRELGNDDARLANSEVIADDAEYAAWHEKSAALQREIGVTVTTIAAQLSAAIVANLKQQENRNIARLRETEIRVARQYDAAATGDWLRRQQRAELSHPD